MTDEAVIQYSVKDVLGRIENKLDGALSALALKAESSDVMHLWETVREQDNRLKIVEAEAEASKKKAADQKAWKQWVIPVLISAIASISMLITVFHK